MGWQNHAGAGDGPPQPWVTGDSQGALPQEAAKQRAGTRYCLRGVCTRAVPMPAGDGQEDPLAAVAQGRRGEMATSSRPSSLQLPPGPGTHKPPEAAAQPGKVYLYLQSSCTASQQGHSPASYSSVLGIFQAPFPQGNNSFSLLENGPHHHQERARACDVQDSRS